MSLPWFEGPDGPAVADRLATLLGAAPVRFRAVSGGYTPVRRAVVELADGTSAFVKLAVNELTAGWARVQEDPAPFLALGHVSAAWLDAALPTLRAAAAAAPFAGDALLHLDVRSDNLCLGAAGARLVDWNLACRGNPDVDVAFWLPSLHAEGGPPPEAVLPGQAELAAWTAGFFAARAGLPGVPDAPFVRHVQRVQLATALPWAIRAVGLPGP